MTHIAQIRGIFDIANSQRYRAGFAPMLFQWSHAHIARFFVVKNRAIKRGLGRKNRAIKKSRYVCHGTKTLKLYSLCILFALNLCASIHSITFKTLFGHIIYDNPVIFVIKT